MSPDLIHAELQVRRASGEKHDDLLGRLLDAQDPEGGGGMSEKQLVDECVTLFAAGNSTTRARLHATFEHGYWEDPNMWPWELYEMLNLATAVEHAHDFDLVHYEAAYFPISLAFARFCPVPLVQTLHHSPTYAEVALWCRYPEVGFVAISDEQAFDQMPVLADALEDAGCADPAILEHCRRRDGHVRGCWLLDAILGKK